VYSKYTPQAQTLYEPPGSRLSQGHFQLEEEWRRICGDDYGRDEPEMTNERMMNEESGMRFVLGRTSEGVQKYDAP